MCSNNPPFKCLSNFIFTSESFMTSERIGACGVQVSLTLLWFLCRGLCCIALLPVFCCALSGSVLLGLNRRPEH